VANKAHRNGSGLLLLFTHRLPPLALPLNVSYVTRRAPALIHPSGSWPLPGHPEAMKMRCR